MAILTLQQNYEELSTEKFLLSAEISADILDITKPVVTKHWAFDQSQVLDRTQQLSTD
jgi:hypothetical protein